MKSLFLTAVALTISVTGAFAGEGNGDPFPFQAGVAVADVPTTAAEMTGPTPLMTKLPPNSVPGSPANTAVAVRHFRTVSLTRPAPLPVDGSQSQVQSANSAPQGFQEGTAADQVTDAAQIYAERYRLAGTQHLQGPRPTPRPTSVGG